MEDPSIEDCEDILPNTGELARRAEIWRKFEEKHSIVEDLNNIFDFDNVTSEEDEDAEESDHKDSFVEAETECRALVPYTSPRKLYKKLYPIIQVKKLELEQKIKRMEFGKKVSEWLQNNAQHMTQPSFFSNGSSTSPIRGRFRMSHTSETDLQFDNSNASSASVNTAAYILANRCKSRRRSTMKLMTIREYCFMEQSEDLLQLDNGPQWQPIEAPTRPLALPASQRPLSIMPPPQPPSEIERRPPQQRTVRKRRVRRVIESDSSDSDSGRVERRTRKAKTPRVEAPVSKKKPPKKPKAKVQESPTEIVLHEPPRSTRKSMEKMIRLTMSMLERKIGREDAKALENSMYLRHPVPASVKIIYDTKKKEIFEVLEDESCSSSSSDSSCGSLDLVRPIKRTSNAQQPRDILIYSPPADAQRSRSTFLVTPELLRGKVDDEVIEHLKNGPMFRLPFPVSCKLMFNTETKQIYESF